MEIRLLLPFCLMLSLNACTDAQPFADKPFQAEVMADFDQPWAMTFLPDGALLVTEMAGELHIYRDGGHVQQITGVPEVAFGGQGGLGDVILHPRFESNQIIYLSYAEPGPDDTSGAAVARAQLTRTENGGELRNLEVIWRQEPKGTGDNHYGHRLAFGPDGYLWITSGERQKMDPLRKWTETWARCCV
jgi:glucose/arabinose dehydrogenase